jgi:hypothetical protein
MNSPVKGLICEQPTGCEMSPETEKTDSTVLTCWKDIANYLGKGVRTVQRWEQEFGLPVRRPKGIAHKSAVIAYARDLDAWLESKWTQKNGHHAAHTAGATSNLDELIRTAQELRTTHDSLLRETRAALTTLVANCYELTSPKYPRRAKVD